MYPTNPTPPNPSTQSAPEPAPPPRSRLLWVLLRVVQNTLLVVVLLWAAFLLLRGVFNLLNSPDLGAVLLQVLLLTAYLAFFLTAQFVFFYFVLSRTRTIWRRPSQLNARRSTVYLSPPVAASIAHTVTLVQSVRDVPPPNSRFCSVACCLPAKVALVRATSPRSSLPKQACRLATSMRPRCVQAD